MAWPKIQGDPCNKCGGTERYSEKQKRCVFCTRAKNKAWDKAHPEVLREANRRYVNRHPDRIKARSKARYHANPQKSREQLRKWQAANREKTRIWARDQYVKNPERYKSNAARWQRDNPAAKKAIQHRRRTRLFEAHGDFTPAEWDAIVAKQRGRCADCKQKRKLTVDHIVPVSKGGCNFAYNLQGLCRPCNSRKKDLLKGDIQFSLFDQTAAA